jgi:hypothetical protein
MDNPTPERPHTDRPGDHGFWCIVARRASDTWDFIDKRDIDKHTLVWAVYALAGYSVYWSMEFVWAHPDKPGLEVGAIVTAVNLPLSWVLAKVTDFYFRARQ